MYIKDPIKKHSEVCNNNCSGFTLVELLVVIAVISILAGMLMPVLENAIVAGNSLNCKNNLKQCSLALFSYTTDNNDYVPKPYTGGKYWADRLVDSGFGEALKNSMTCPTFDPEEFITPQWAYGMTAAPTYHGSWPWNSYRLSDLAKGPGVNPTGNFSYSNIPIIMDSINTVGGTKQWYRTYCTCYPSTSTSQIHCRHGGQGNVLFLDTHVENVDAIEPTVWEWHPHLATE